MPAKNPQVLSRANQQFNDSISKLYITVYHRGLINKYRVLELLELSVILDNWRCHRRGGVHGQITHHRVLTLYMHMDSIIAKPTSLLIFPEYASFMKKNQVRKDSRNVTY